MKDDAELDETSFDEMWTIAKAIHEAGHAVVAHFFGWELEKAIVLKDSDHVEYAGYCKHSIPEYDGDPEKDLRKVVGTSLVVLYAGNQAQRVFYDRFIKDTEKDNLPRMVPVFRKFFLGGGQGDKKGIEEILCSLGKDGRMKWKKKCIEWTKEIVDHYFPVIHFISVCLMDAPEGIDGGELKRLIETFEESELNH